MKPTKILGLILAMICSGCGDEMPAEPAAATAPGASGARCPPGSALTYDSFAHGFFTDHCTRCHNSALSGSARHGAPTNYNWDSLEGILAVPAATIDAMAAAGPNQINTFMPPSDPVPSEAQREQLGEWLACGRP